MSEIKATKISKQPPTADYGDHELFGTRIQTTRLIDQLKTGNDSECVVFAVGTFSDKEQWKVADLIGRDKRLSSMFRELNIRQALPMQRYCWPKIHKSRFANLFVSPEATGKTHAHVLYAVSRCILSVPVSRTDHMLEGNIEHNFRTAQESNLEDVINHPKYIIICSSQDNVDNINRTIEGMKEKAYGITATDSRRRLLPPVSRTINVHQDSDKLVLRCNESDILIGTPPALLKCLQADYINFSNCKKVFFDDLDVALQLQNNNVRELVKIYLIQDQLSLESIDPTEDKTNRPCRMHLFSRKWTDLVKQFMSTIFPQRIALFSSLAEASIYNNIRFDVESYKSIVEKRQVISSLISVLVERSRRDKIAIVCRTDDEARSMTSALKEMGHSVKLLTEEDMSAQLKPQPNGRSFNDLVFVISDRALEFEVEYSTRRKPLNDVMHIIHASLPNDMLLFDQRFRLSFRNIQDNKTNMTSTVLIGPDFNPALAKQLHDLMSRSSQTLKSSKLIVRDFISSNSNYICWRWATTGLCRLEKLSRDDRFGSYCPDRHSFAQGSPNNWPQLGLVRVTLTHIVSPSEFYFWFESHKTLEDGKWVKLDRSGVDFMEKLQIQLNELKSAETRSVPLSSIKKGKVYGVYFPQEARVDRVLLMDEPRNDGTGSSQDTSDKLNPELEYSKLVPVFKIDYGSHVEVVVKNLIALPESLSRIPPHCHRGFHLGYKPTDNEPNWLYKSKKQFHEAVTANSAHEIYLWLRLNRDNCFWFENMLVSRRLINIDSSDVCTIKPHRELYTAGLAELATTEPPGLLKSTRLETMCKWNHDKLKEVAQFAFLRRDIAMPEIILLDVLSNFEIVFRHTAYKKQLDNLELELSNEFKKGKFIEQNYFAANVYCIAKIVLDKDSSTFNRVKILEVYEQIDDIESPKCAQEGRVKVYCLDHGDIYVIAKSNLYQASINHLKILPFQAITCKLANINQQLLSDRALNVKTRGLIVDATRFDNNDYRAIKCSCDEDGHLYLFVLNDEQTQYEPLYLLVSKHDGLQLHAQVKPEYEQPVMAEVQADGLASSSDGRACNVNKFILTLLRDIVASELKLAGVECGN